MENKTIPQELQENKMGVMPIGKLLFNMALPMIISMIVQALYNVVDSIYVSQVSESAVTALSLAFPVQNMQIGFGLGITVGVNSLLSKSLGEKNQEAANYAAGNGIFLVIIAVALFMLFGVFGAIGFASVANTFCHIRAHFLVSLLRTGIGLVLGLVLGAIVLLILRACWPAPSDATQTKE